MRLTRLDIRGFGTLSGTYPLEVGDERLALILERNEAGKTTLTAAILAGLYGFPAERRRPGGPPTTRDTYRPWQGGEYGLTLFLRADGRELAVDRDFDQDSVRVLAGGADITDQFQHGGRIHVGEKLTGLTRQQFLLSTFVGQGDLVWSDGSGLTEALQRVADTQAGSITAAQALDVLENGLASYPGITLKSKGRIETEIRRCEEKIETDERALAQLDRQREELASVIDDVAQRQRHHDRRTHRRRALRLRRLRTQLLEMRAALEQDDHVCERIDELRAEIEGQADLLDLTPETFQALEGSRRVLETDRGLAREAQRQLAEIRQAHQRRVEARNALGLTRAPTETDLETLTAAHTRREDAQRMRAQLETALRQEDAQLSGRGLTLDDAVELAASFDGLDAADHDLLVRHARETLTREGRREQLSQEISRCRRKLEQVARGQKQRQRGGLAAIGAGVALMAAAIGLGGSLRLDPWWLHVPGGLLALGGLAAWLAGGRHGRREQFEYEHRLSMAQDEQSALEEEDADTTRQWNELAARVRCPADDLERRFQTYRSVERSIDTVSRLRDRLDEVERLEKQALVHLDAVWTVFPDAPAPDEIEDRLRLLQKALRTYRDLEREAEALAAAEREAREAVARAEDTERLDELLRRCGVHRDTETSLDEAYAQAQERAERAQLLRHHRDVTLADLQRRALGDAARRELESRVGVLEQELGELRASAPRDESERHATGWNQADEALTVEAFDAELARLDEEEHHERKADDQQRTDTRAFLSLYEREAPVLRTSIERHRTALRRARDFAAAIELAKNTLQQISRETYRDWAKAINQGTNEILRAIGSQVRDLRFDEQLELQLKHSGRLLTGAEAEKQLSAGAIDGVYLAARIAVSRYLSGGKEVLPLILDDPFSNADDHRLLSGLELLLQAIAPQQQVLLMACQTSRYAWARTQLGASDRLVVTSVSLERKAASPSGGMHVS